MRYPRNVKIFRGGIDAAPFAGMFFVTMLMMMLFYSHVFFPGVPIELGPETEEPSVGPRAVRVLKHGELMFLGVPMPVEALDKELQTRAQRGTLPRRVVLETDHGADSALAERVQTSLTAAGIAIKLPGSRLELPEDAGFTGAANPVLVVAMNLNGQIFFEQQLLREEVLQERLMMAVERSSEPLTLVLQADKMVPLHKITRLSQIARRAGIKRVQLATRPGVG
jgi:biopolymer transport protein ExbD